MNCKVLSLLTTGKHCDEKGGCYDVLNDLNVKVKQAITRSFPPF